MAGNLVCICFFWKLSNELASFLGKLQTTKKQSKNRFKKIKPLDLKEKSHWANSRDKKKENNHFTIIPNDLSFVASNQL